MKRSIGNPKHYPYAPILRPLPPSSRKGHIGTTRRKAASLSHSRAGRNPERDNHEDESKIIFFIITIGGALLFPFYGPSTS
jgi:hypothetical protein